LGDELREGVVQWRPEHVEPCGRLQIAEESKKISLTCQWKMLRGSEY
jgi:hypothetical protein